MKFVPMILAFAFSVPFAAQANNPSVQNCGIRFHTNNEDKDSDTHVTVVVRDANGVVVCRSDNDYGHFDDNSNAGPYGIRVMNRSLKSAVQAGSITLRVDPNGHDTWRFNFFLDVLFDDASHLSGGADGLELSHNRREQTFGLEGLLRSN